LRAKLRKIIVTKVLDNQFVEDWNLIGVIKSRLNIYVTFILYFLNTLINALIAICLLYWLFTASHTLFITWIWLQRYGSILLLKSFAKSRFIHGVCWIHT
jgi:hypothetical protein